MTDPSTSSTNDVNNAKPAYEVSTASPNVNTASPQVSTASFSDNAVYAFMVENPNGSNLLQQDLEQIHEDDLEAMDLKWQLSLLSMRAKRYYQRTGKKIFINANDTARYDKSKVECFNCHKMGHFARECRAPRNKEGQFRNQDNTRKQGNNEDTSSKAMLAIDGVGFDWSDMAEEQVQTNMALMAFSDSEVYNDKTCSKTCLKNYETLKKQCDDLIVKLNQTEFTAATYKRGLATVEEQLITYRKNEVLFSEEVAVLKREVACKDYEINVLKSEFEKVKQEKEGIEFKIEKFDKALKDLDKLLRSQITDKSKKGLRYNVIPPPYPLIYNRPKKLDLSYYGLDEFKDPEFKSYGSDESKQESNIVSDKKSDASKENFDDSLVKEQVSEDTSSFVESPLNVDKETIFLADKKKEFIKPKNHEKPVKKSVRLIVNTIKGKGWNIVPRAVLMKTGLKPFNTARTLNTTHPKFIGKPLMDDKGFVDSGCSRHMTGNIAYLSDFKEFDGGYVKFGGGAHGSRISGKGTLKTDSLDFEDLYFLPDESQTLLKIPRKDNIYSFDMKNIVPKESLTCLVAKATSDKSMLWHRRLVHINFKNINKLVKDNLVKGLPIKFTDDYSRFTWVFFLTTKDETSEVLKKFFKEIENLVDKKVKIIRSYNGTEFKNKVMDDFCREKGIKREYSIARTLQQNGMAERRNKTLIEAARTMLADSKLPTTFWAEAVSTACYVHNKTPYELFRGFKPPLSFMRPFGCHVTILNTLDNLGKIDGKSDEGFFVGYSLSSKAFRVQSLMNLQLHKENLMQDVGNGDPKSVADDQKQVKDGPDNENDEKDKSEDDSSPKEVNTAGQHVNTASPEVNTGRFKLNTIDPSVNTASSSDPDSPKDMFTIGDSHTLEATHVEFFSDEDEPEVDLGNILNSYTVPTTPNTRIHKDHPYKNVIGDIEPTRIAKALSDSSLVEAMQEELLQFKLQQVWKLVDLPNRKRNLIEELDLDARISLVLPNVADQGKIDDTWISDQPEEKLEEEEKLVLAVVELVLPSESPKKIKKRVQVQMSVDEELAKNVFEEEQARFNAEYEARFKEEQEQERIDFETTLECKSSWMKEKKLHFSVAEVRKNICLYLKNQGGYKMSHFKGMSYEDIRPIFERVWDQNQAFIPMGSEIEKEVMKRSGFDLQQESLKPVEEEIVQQDDVIAEQAVKESSRTARGRRKKSLARKRARETLSEESAKKQKLEDDTEKEELQVYLNIVPEEESLNIESLATKYPIVDWETQILANDKYYYQIKRADGSVKHYKIFSAMLYDFDRQDVLELYRLVKERFQTASPEGYDLLLWGDLKTMIEPNEEDEIWRNQQDWNLINWKLHNFCGVHVLLMDTGFVIHMMVEKKYPLSQDTLSKMLSRRLEVDHQSEMGYELIRHVKRGRDTKIPQSSGPPVKVDDEAVHKELGDIMERAATTASSLEARAGQY
ncbi:retrovirus-related pol polyprotein from transposon TNT 1-94 [Tanacetum coccineum]